MGGPSLPAPDDATFMREALLEGRKALPACHPNPPVGCVIVRDGRIIARGHPQAPGRDHAEAMALRAVTGSLADATVYVTLEPCSFHGRTPSCAAALVRHQVRRVVVAMIDPDARNNGAGIRMLRAAGLNVVLGALELEARRELLPHLALPENR